MTQDPDGIATANRRTQEPSLDDATRSSALGRLTSVAPRAVWPHEAHDFTPWLLRNVDVLSDLLGMDLVLEVAEHPVGGFSLDLKGYDGTTGEVVIVENQLEMSDHTHLGQIITYAAGTDPTTIIWVTTGFRSEHRAAIDWLNERTDENTRVFGVVIRVVRIGDSAPAPNFELVAQPNDWNKIVKRATNAASSSQSSELGSIYQEFWDAVLERIRELHPTWTRRVGGTRASWCDTAFGVSGVVGSMTWTRNGLESVIYFLANDPELATARFNALFARRHRFEDVVGDPVVWDPMEGRKASRLGIRSPFVDVSDREQWPAMVDWLISAQERLRAGWAAVSGGDGLDVL